MTDAFDFDAYLRLPRVSGLRVSPDGQRLVVSVGRPAPDGKKMHSSLWELDASEDERPRRLTRSAPGESAATFARDGSILFTSTRPDPDRAPDDGRRTTTSPACGCCRRTGARHAAGGAVGRRGCRGRCARRRCRRVRRIGLSRDPGRGERSRAARGAQEGRRRGAPVRVLADPSLGRVPRPARAPPVRRADARGRGSHRRADGPDAGRRASA